jgi:hypothetical protein
MKPQRVLMLLLLALGCMKNPSDLPEPGGYEGLLELGWNSVKEGRYYDGMNYFREAIEVDVGRTEAYLGTGVTSIFIESYWEEGENYFQMAVQRSLGFSAIEQRLNQTIAQDTLWTVIECIDPDLPADSLNNWLASTADSGAVWVGEQINNYLTANDLSTDLSFRLIPDIRTIASCVDLYNMQNGASYNGDSISEGYVHFTVPRTSTQVGQGISYFQWVMADQGVLLDYTVAHGTEQAEQSALDALAGWAVLEEAKGEQGDLLQSTACSQYLIWAAPDYRFGSGDSLLESVFNSRLEDIVACSASLAYVEGKFIYSWFMCKQMGYGLYLDPLSETFLLDLLGVLMEMQN